jgi:hypothetical protein
MNLEAFSSNLARAVEVMMIPKKKGPQKVRMTMTMTAAAKPQAMMTTTRKMETVGSTCSIC